MSKLKYIKFTTDKFKSAGEQLADFLNEHPEADMIDVQFTYSEFYNPDSCTHYETEIAHLLYREDWLY